MALRVEVVRAWPDSAEVVELRLPDGATVRDALSASGIAGGPAGIFGKRVALHARLADGDRVEVYRPLPVDPKEARRTRAARAGKRARR